MKNKKLLLKQLNEQSVTKPSLEDRCNIVLQKNQRNRQPDGKIHPSSIGGCPRLMYFFMKKIPYTNELPHSPNLQRIFDMGKDYEIRVKKNMKAANILVDVDIKIPENTRRVAGECDAIACMEGEYYVTEIKSANDYQYSKETPHYKYKYQTATYMIFLQIPNGKIYYGNKNTSEQLEFDININDSIIKETNDLIDYYNYNYDNKIIPDVTNIKPNCNATSCKYFNLCDKFQQQATLDTF